MTPPTSGSPAALVPATSDPEPVSVETAVGPVAVSREGDPRRPALLCVHGIPGTGRDFRYLAPLLSEHFFVVRFDMPGFGGSPIGSVRSVGGWADAIVAVADALAIERYVVVAHSFGGSAALMVANARADRVAGLALLASPGGRMHRGYGAPSVTFWLAAQLTRVPLLRVPMVGFVRGQFARRGLKSPDDWRLVHNQLRVVASLRFEPLARWATEVTCPVIVAHTDDDPLVEVEIAREQAARFRDCECLFWREGGHHIQKTHATDIAEALVRRFT